MSGSPMYSFVAVDPVTAALGLTVSAGLALARRQRERERAEQRAALARERARQAELRRAEIERRNAELAGRRRAEQEAHAARTRQEYGRADARRLDEVEQLIIRVRAAAGSSDALAAAGRRLAELRGRVGEGGPLGGAIEELRGQVVLLHPSGDAPAARTDQYEVLADLEQRLADAGANGEGYDEAGRLRCADLLVRLRAAAGPEQVVAFEALLGTTEHALVRHTATVAGLAEARHRAQAAEAERAEALREELAEAEDRFGVVDRAARHAVRDAVELGDPELADRLEDVLDSVTGALAAEQVDAALAAVAELERLLPLAEERLDELQVAHARRGELAKVLRDAMTGAGLSFSGGEDLGERFVLSFERPTGATYEATVQTDAEGNPVLTYHVDGESDMSVRTASESGAVCEPEELLDRVHRAMHGDGFVPGELTWDDKPPRQVGLELPGNDARRTP
ncbi:hypothetical protein [Streptomyces sp. NPDC000410]|uniref:hypothetical protein n=1 Tax=Streptomyces sp. NPDC000410 TaxID=3154254 RepID=UPI0033200ABF